MKIGFIGFGRMGGVIAERALKEKKFGKKDACAYAPSASTRKRIKRLGISAAKDAAEVVRRSKFVWLCVKPQKMTEALASLRSVHGLSKKVFVSIAAGVPLAKIEQQLGRNVAVLRVMPNTPSLLGAGISAVSRGRSAKRSDEAAVKTILSSLGAVVSVPEKQMHAVTATSGSGPAYIFNMAEALIAGAKKLGLNQALATKLVNETIYGAGRMLKELSTQAGKLRRQVTSPGGTTAAALKEFEKRGFGKIVETALKKAVQRSKELGQIK